MGTEIVKPIALDETAKATNAILRQSAIMIVDAISGRDTGEYINYGFHINSNEADPYKAVTYIEDAAGMVPAKMNYLNDFFSYGSWADAFFIPRPCMVKYDGTVDYYLDPDDYEKKENGDMSALGDSTLGYGLKYPGNAMMEWGQFGWQIWTKTVPDADDPKSGSVYISNKQVDEDYTAYSFINNQGILVKHFYTAIYNGSATAYKSSGTTYYRLRSIPRRIVMNSPDGNTTAKYEIPWDDGTTDTAPAGFSNTTAQNEINLALNNNPLINHAISANLDLATNRSNIGWFTEVFCDIQLINNLLVLISKSLNSQEAFGNGNINGYDLRSSSYANNGVLYTGSDKYVSQSPQYDKMNKAGLFWGSTSIYYAVKVFGMENWWGNQWRRYAGHFNKSNGTTQQHYIKQTFGTEDGSGVVGYNTDGANYIDSGVTVPSSNNFIKSMQFVNKATNTSGTYKVNTFLPVETSSSATSSSYYCDYIYYSTGTLYAYRGGGSGVDFLSGAFSFRLANAASTAVLGLGAALSFKPVV